MGPQITQIALMDEENTADAGNVEKRSHHREHRAHRVVIGYGAIKI